MSRHLRALLALLAVLALLAAACGDDDDTSSGDDDSGGGDSEEEVLEAFCDLDDDVDDDFEALNAALGDEDADGIEDALNSVRDQIDDANDLDLAVLDEDLADAMERFGDAFGDLVDDAADVDFDAGDVIDLLTEREDDEDLVESSDFIDDYADDNCDSDDTTPETDEDTTPDTEDSDDTTPETDDDTGSGSDAADAIAAGILSQTPYAGGSEEECIVEGLDAEFDEDELEELYTADEFSSGQVETVSAIFEDCLPFEDFVAAAVENQTGDTAIVDCVLETYEDAEWAELFTDPASAQQALVAAIELCSDGGGGVDAPTPNAPGTDVSWFDANTGDCFDAADSESGSYRVIDCDDPHTAEIFSVFELPDGEFPGDDVVQQAAREGCNADIEGYAGAPAADLGVEIGTLFPTEDTWSSLDDREIVCYASGELQGSIFGAA